MGGVCGRWEGMMGSEIRLWEVMKGGLQENVIGDTTVPPLQELNTNSTNLAFFFYSNLHNLPAKTYLLLCFIIYLLFASVLVFHKFK